MTSTVTAKGQTMVPKKLLERFRMAPGSTLHWREDGDSIRMVMAPENREPTDGLEWLKRLGRVPAAPRDSRPVEPK